jgi:hypothetical protein
MKKMYLFALLALTTLSYGQITNGTFDTDLTGWTLSNANATRSTTSPRNGAGCLLIQNSSTVYQNFTATVGTTYTIVYTSRHTTQASPTADPTLYVSIAGENNVTLAPVLGGFGTAYLAANGNTYVRTRFTFVAPQANLALVFARFGANTNVAVRIDDVSISASALPTIAASTAASNTSFAHGGSGIRQSPTFTADPVETITYAFRGTNISGAQATGPINVGQFNALASVPSGTGKDMCNVAFSITPIALIPSLSTYNFNGSPQGPTVATPAQQTGTGTIAFTYRGTGSTVYAESATRPTAIGTYEVVMTYTRATIAQDNYSPTTSTTAFNIAHATTWTGGTSNVWTEDSNWSNGLPTADSNVTLVSGVFQTVISSDVTINNLTINAGRRLTVSSGALTVKGSIVNNNLLFVENNANLIQTAATDSNSGSGTVTVTRESNTLKRLDYTLWSTPIKTGNLTLASFSPLTTETRNYIYNPASNLYNSISNVTTFNPGTGYLIRMPDQNPNELGNQSNYYKGLSNLIFSGVFTGSALNNGPVTIATTASTYNAIGNPYPSAISANSFLSGNSTDGTLYFWRKTNGAGTSYASYTVALGGISNGGFTPNGTIQVGQGFIVRANSTSLVFNNTMRTASNSQFLKTRAQAEKSRVWLNLNNAEGMVNQTLVGYLDVATKGVDQGIDGKSFGDGEIELASSIDGESYTIQGRPAFDATDVVALNFKTNVAGSFNIAIDKVDGLFSKGQDIYLVDKKLGVTTNLNEGAYSFTADAGVDNTRFTLTYQKTLKVDAPLFNENSVLVSRNNGTVNVKSSAVAINNVKVFDIQGRLVAERKNVKSNTASFSNLKANQVLIVKVASENNAVVTKKVLN